MAGAGGSRRAADATDPTNSPAASSSGWRSPGRSSTEPALVLADEPTGNLDSRSATEIAELLQQVARDWGRCVLMVTHDPRIASYAQRLVLMKDGVIVDDLHARRHPRGSSTSDGEIRAAVSIQFTLAVALPAGARSPVAADHARGGLRSDAHLRSQRTHPHHDGSLHPQHALGRREDRPQCGQRLPAALLPRHRRQGRRRPWGAGGDPRGTAHRAAPPRCRHPGRRPGATERDRGRSGVRGQGARLPPRIRAGPGPRRR